MSSVFLDNPTNSTMFTTCCECAITDRENKCPRCGEDVEPKGERDRWFKAYGRIKRGLGYGNYGQRKFLAQDSKTTKENNRG